MAYRKIENIEEKVIAAVIKIGAHDGIQATTALKVAAECDTSDFTVLRCFGSKQGYLDAAAEHFDRSLMTELYTIINEGKTSLELWDIAFDSLLENPDGVLYYNRYINETGFDPTPNNTRTDEWLPMAKALFCDKPELTDEQYLLMWDFITTMGLYYAQKIIEGFVEDSPTTRANIRTIVFKGLNGFKESEA